MSEKWTYLPYSRGIDPKRLRIGSLFLDIYNPATGLEKKRLKFMNDEPSQETYWAKIQSYTGDPEPEAPYSMQFEASKDSSIGAMLAETVHFHGEKSGSVFVAIEGLSGRRYEVEEPERFFLDAVLPQPGVEQWIRKQLAISFFARGYNRLRHKSKGWKAPDIWVCTGIQLITGGYVRSGATKASGVGAGAALDAGLAMGGPPIGAKIAAADFDNSNFHGANAGYGYKDERVWAAQFYRLDIEYGKSSGPGAKTLERPLEINLYEIEDLGSGFGVRPREVSDDKDDEATEMEPVEQVERVARIVGLEELRQERQSSDAAVKDDGASKKSSNASNIRVDENPYAKSMKGINWEEYEKYSKYVERMAEYED